MIEMGSQRIASSGRSCGHALASHLKATAPPDAARRLNLMPRVSRYS
jgi:hypothetical protein